MEPRVISMVDPVLLEQEIEEIRESLAIERPTADRVRPYLYQLPLELFTIILDHLNFEDILYLCEDPEFPVHLLSRRHIENDGKRNTIVHIATKIGRPISVIEKFLPVLENWDVAGPECLTPLGLAVVCNNYDLCQAFVKAGARVNPAESESTAELAPLWIAASASRKCEIVSLLIKHGASMSWRLNEWEVIHVATRYATVSTVELLLQHGADAKRSTPIMMKTPLHLAKDSSVAKLLIENGADVNARDQFGCTPLVDAAALGNPKLVRVLLLAGTDVNIFNRDLNPDEDDYSPLSLAMKSESVETVLMILSSGYDISRRSNSCYLFMTSNPTITKSLIAYGADINAKNEADITPLMWASQERLYQLVETYLTAGAEIYASFLQEFDFLHDAVEAGEYNVVKLLLSRFTYRSLITEDASALPAAIYNRYEGIVRLLIEADVDLVNEEFAHGDYSFDDEDDKQYASTLCLAAADSSASLVQKLIDAGAKVDFDGVDGQTPLFHAINNRREGNVQVLLNAGADPSHICAEIMRPAIMTVAGSRATFFEIDRLYRHESVEWLSTLNKLGRPSEKETQIDHAMLQMLLKHGADVSEAEWQGHGILHIAAWRSDERIINTLLAAGADPTVEDDDGDTPADWAAGMKNSQIESILRKAQAEYPKKRGQQSK